ncbi:hypothetical protein MMC14_000380 [Varicellaria rhodocarpa]|nr:hypothetical protein [Varicellaria rhodocarpa]
MPSKMTANPVKPSRHRAGKPVTEESSDEEASDLESEDSRDKPDQAKRISVEVAARTKVIEPARSPEVEEEEGFVTESSEDAEGNEISGDNEEESEETSEEEDESEQEKPRLLLRPTFIRKDMRRVIAPTIIDESEAQQNEKADALVQEQLEKNAAARAAGKKHWDDDEEIGGDTIDDTDGLDPEAEYEAWKLREFKRVKRERDTIETAEKEREEVDRRRNLSKEERDAEDREFIEQQRNEQDSKGKMGYLQKYYHKGAFFQDDAKAEGLDRRDIMGSRYQDDVKNREALPEYMQIRDMTRLGRKGRTKYKDLKSEDTGRWGAFEGKGPRRADGSVDERFMPDRDGARGASGANAIEVREKRQAPESAPEGPRAGVRREVRHRDDTYTPDRNGREGRHDPRSPIRRAQRSNSRPRSPSPRRNRWRDDRDRRKRSPSPHSSRYDRDKRRKREAS